MKKMDLAEFNKLLKSPNHHPLYTALESMSVDELIGFLHKAGFKCGTTQDFKRVILWAVSDELMEKKRAALDAVSSKKISAIRFAEFFQRIYGLFVSIESNQADPLATRKVAKLIEKLEELRRLDRFAGQNYIPDNIVSAVELKMHRWLWRHQSASKNLPTQDRHLKTEPNLIPILNSIVTEVRAAVPNGVRT